MTEGENTAGGEAPLRYNPWRGPRGPFAIARGKAREDKRRAVEKVIPNAIVDALLETTVGTDFEARRNRAALVTLIYTGVRAEELVGALRKDLVSIDGVLALQVFGKGDKYRTIPIYAEVRDALAQLDAKIEEVSQIQSEDPDVRWKAAYATTLLQSQNAPIIPALPRWGANARDVDPTKAAVETLDTSGLRAILSKLIDRARVYDRRIRTVRPLTQEERALVHPHAMRHYAATAAQEAGLPMEDVKRLLGHEDLRTTEGYVHVPARSMAQFGAYIAQARAGAVMSPEEAEKLRRSRRSALEDPNIVAAPAEEEKRRTVASKPKPREVQEVEVEQRELPPETSPVWAYEPGREKLDLYLPRIDDMGQPFRADRIPVGKGYLLNFRRGSVSKLPWWAGRANRWPASKMAPVISYYQAFGTTPDLALKYDMQAQFVSILRDTSLAEDGAPNGGITAASAYAEWVGEILGYASAQFFETMLDRGDEWVNFDQPASPSDDEVVRMHAKDKILEWFQKNAMAAASPVIRSRPAWLKWEGNVEVIRAQRIDNDVFESSLRVSKTPSFEEYFSLKSEKMEHKGEDVTIDAFFKGTGKGRKRIRFRAVGDRDWKHAILSRKDKDWLDPNKAVIIVVGDAVPDNVSNLEVSVDKMTEKEKREQANLYPMLVDRKDLPIWYFSEDPIGELPDAEREAIRDWIEKLQGTKISRMRVVSRATQIADYINSWKAQNKDFYDRKSKMTDAEIAGARRRIRETEEEIKKASIETFGVAVDPVEVSGVRGADWMRQLKKSRPEVASPMYESAEGDWEKRLNEAGEDVEKQFKMSGRLPPLEKRIFAYVQLEKGLIPISQWGIKDKPIIDDSEGLFKEANIVWKDGTIKHTEAFKQNFFKAHGTDSECVVRRMVRDMWERKKLHEFQYLGRAKKAPPIHRDILHRHASALMAYLIPCPKAMELEILDWFNKGLTPVDIRGMWYNFDEDKLGEIAGQAEDLREAWLSYKGETVGETAESLGTGILEEFESSRAGITERIPGGFAKPNAARGLRAIPNLISLVFAEFWPV